MSPTDSSHRDSVSKPEGSIPTPWLVIRDYKGRPFYEAAWWYGGQRVKRRVGPAWLERGEAGAWQSRRGRVPAGSYSERTANVRADELVKAYVAGAGDRERVELEASNAGVNFREVAKGYLRWLENVKGARPSTLRQHGSDLAEPDAPYKRGQGLTHGYIMRALGDLPAEAITRAEVEALLRIVADSGVAPRTVNRVRAVVSAVFNFGMRSTEYELPQNPATAVDRRSEPRRGVLIYYSPEEVEAVARALADGLHRDRPRDQMEDNERLAAEAEDRQDAEAVRVAAYAGLRRGELLALRWRDVDWTGSALTVSRALSAGVEGPTKSGHVRRVPLSDQAAAALERLSHRQHFIGPDELVFCSMIGDKLDGSALRRRYIRARDRAGLRPLRWHDLRHTFGSLLVAAGVDVVTVKDAMGHSQIATTERYLHARPAIETAARFSAAFRPTSGDAVPAPSEAVSGA